MSESRVRENRMHGSMRRREVTPDQSAKPRSPRKPPADPTAGKTVIDTCNYGPERDGHIRKLDDRSLTSSELLGQHMPGAMIVKALTTSTTSTSWPSHARRGAADRSSLPIAGDSVSAKAIVADLFDFIGYDVVNAGPLADSWRQATSTPVWGTPYGLYSNAEGQPADEEAGRHALVAAAR